MLILKKYTLLIIVASIASLVSCTIPIPETGGAFFYATLEKGSLSGIPDGNYYVNVNISDARQGFKMSLDPYSYSLSVMKAESAADIASSNIDVVNRYNSTESQTYMNYNGDPNSFVEKNYIFPYHLDSTGSYQLAYGTLVCDVALDNIKMQLTHWNRQTSLNFIPFLEISKIEDSTQSYKMQDGFIGLEPYQNSISQDINLTQSLNFMKAMRDANIITNEIFMVQIDKDTQVVKFGGYDQGSIYNQLVVLECSDSSSYKLDSTQILINGVNALQDSASIIRKVRLDISQPYLYMPKDDYDAIVKGIGESKNLPTLNCDQDLNICRWHTACSKITEAATATISIVVQDHTDPTKTVTLVSKVTDLLLDGSNFGQKEGEYCYLPIFSSYLATTPVKDEWYIGNLFLRDKVLVFDNAYQRDQDQSPQIGFGDLAQNNAGEAALKNLYDRTDVNHNQYVYHQANDSSVPSGYYNGVSIPQLVDLRDSWIPETSCDSQAAKGLTLCVPNPIVIPNPYPLPIAPAAVEIPNAGGFFYASLESGAIDGISDGAKYVNVNISDTQNNFKLTLNPYVYGLSVVNSINKGGIVPKRYINDISPTNELIQKQHTQNDFIYQFSPYQTDNTTQLADSQINFDAYYESFKMKLTQYGRQTGLDFLPFMSIFQIQDDSQSQTQMYKSNYDGFIGLAPYQSQSSLKDSVPSVNMIKALRDNNMITNEVTMVQIDKEVSVVKFGGYDQSAIEGFLTILQCHEQNNYWLEMTQMMVNGVNVIAATTGQLTIRVVRIDISQPYLYLPADDYTKVISFLGQPTVLPTLNCDHDLNVCKWDQPCSTVKNLEGITFSIIVQDHTDPTKTVNLETNVVDLLLDGSNFGYKPEVKCYLPIFASKLPESSSNTNSQQWYVGNLFVRDKVLVFDNAYSRDQTLNPQIGFGTKAKDGKVALQTLYDVNYSKYSEFGNNKANDQSVPTGYFNSVVIPEAFDFRETGTPDTTCPDDGKECVPIPIPIPNPYPYPVRPPSPAPTPTPPQPNPPAGSSLGVIIGVTIGSAIVIVAVIAVGILKCKKRGGPGQITQGQRIPIMDENNSSMSFDKSQSDMDGPMKKAIQ